MKFLTLNTDYPEFVRWLYAQYPGLDKEPYERQLLARNESFSGLADFYARSLRCLGHEAERIRRAGLARAKRDHAWENRFRQLFKVIGLAQKA